MKNLFFLVCGLVCVGAWALLQVEKLRYRRALVRVHARRQA